MRKAQMDFDPMIGGSPESLILALVIDRAFGEPPTQWHPVAWMGSTIAAAQRRAPRNGRLGPLAWGALIAAGGALVFGGLGYAAQRLVRRLPPLLRWPAEAALLKSMLSVRSLSAAAGEVESALAAGNLPEARRLASWHLVSRDTSTLSAQQVAAATIESVAENASDGVVAPLFYYAVGGLPAAFAYRFLNTADAMLGYRDAAREWLGKVPARADDAANLLPARLTAGLLTLSAALLGEDAGNAWRIWQRDAGKTASPNAGHPMSAAAGALGVELEKVGHYRLGGGQRLPEADDIRRTVRLMGGAALLAGGLFALWSALRSRRETR
jgi:adenosylcobinamide-phosphate synthase